MIFILVSRILFLCDNLSGIIVANDLKRHSPLSGARPCTRVRILHVSAGLNRIVSVRTSILADGGRYPLPFPDFHRSECSDFPPHIFGNQKCRAIARNENLETLYHDKKLFQTFVGRGRLELPCLAALAPKASVSAISPPAHFSFQFLLCYIFIYPPIAQSGRAVAS